MMRSAASRPPLCRDQTTGMGAGITLAVHRPARDLAERGEPDVIMLLHVAKNFLEHRRDHRAATEMAMHRQREQRRLLMVVQVVEGFAVDVPEILRARS